MEKIKYEGIDEIVYYEKLPNGLDVYMYPSDTSKNFYLTFNTRFGSLDTEYKIEGSKKINRIPQGTAHFLEHQMFQEESGHTAFEDFAALGSSVNAFTSYEITCYEVISSEKFSENLELLLNFVQNPVFKASSVASEKGIIKEEIKMYDDNPNTKSTFGLEYNLNIKDRHKYLISGTEEEIKTITPDILMNTYETFYHPANMFIVITGKFKVLEALGIIKENQNKKEFKPYKQVIKIREKEPSQVSVSYEEKEMDVSIPKINIGIKISKKDFKDDDMLKLKIYLDAILSIKFGPTSDFLESLIKGHLISWDIKASNDFRDDYILITLSIESDYKDEVISLVREELSNIKITKEELSRIKKTNIANFILSFNDIITICENIQDDIITYGKIQNDILEVYKSLNVKEANEIAKKIDLSNECVYIINKTN